MTTQTIQIEVSGTLLERARVQALDEARELITFLLENYVQELEKAQRRQAYEAYYAARTPEDEAEELELLAEFACADKGEKGGWKVERGAGVSTIQSHDARLTKQGGGCTIQRGDLVMNGKPIQTQVLEVLSKLPPVRQAEVLDFVLFLRQRELALVWDAIGDEQAAALRAQFAEEDLALADAAMANYLSQLRREDVA